MSPPKIRFGITLPQHNASWEEARSTAILCEEIGFDSLWAVDHLFSIPDPTDTLLEGWTEITAIAALTNRIHIGHLVLCMNYRHPALLAKMAATLDQISAGRFILGLGCGWHAEEAQAYGIPFPPVRTRLQQLDEGISLIRTMWQESPAEYYGEQFQIENAYCQPAPLQKPHPRFWSVEEAKRSCSGSSPRKPRSGTILVSTRHSSKERHKSSGSIATAWAGTSPRSKFPSKQQLRSAPPKPTPGRQKKRFWLICLFWAAAKTG